MARPAFLPRGRVLEGAHGVGTEHAVLPLLDEKWCAYSIEFMQRMAKAGKPWLLYHCTRGAHFDNYPHERFLGSSPAKHPYKDTLIRSEERRVGKECRSRWS